MSNSPGIANDITGAVSTAAAPLSGGASLLLPLLMKFGPAILQHLFHFGVDPRKQLQELLAQGPARTNAYYQQILGSPAYSQAQGNIATGANQTANNLAQSLASRGIGTTGTGAVLSSLAPSIVGSQQAGLRTSAYNQAQDQWQQELRAKLGQVGQASPGQTAFAGGLEQFSPYLEGYLKQRFPKMYGDPASGNLANAAQGG